MMRIRTRARLVPFALCATGLLVLFLAGCRKEEAKPETPASSPASYMNDPVFRKQLEEKRSELSAIVKERKPLADRMQELVKEHGEDLAALQKIPEWNDLYKKVTALNKKYEETRARQLRIVRERISPKNGEATSASLQGKSGRSGEDAASPVKKDISK